MFDAFGLSDPGCVRSNNEDYFINDTDSGIFILADGMGGAKAGEHAASQAAERLHKFLLTGKTNDWVGTLEQGFEEANSAVREAARDNPEFEGMGTTLVAAVGVGPDQLQIASVGDSRVYLCSDHEMSSLTKDQTWVAEVGSRLGLSEQALKTHPMRHVLTMAIGCADQLRVHTQAVSLRIGDQLLMCSDGLHGVVEEKNLKEILLSEKSLEEKCHYLVEAAKANGGPDNVTVVLIRLV